MADIPETVSEVLTPCLLVDINKAKANASRMINRCKQLGIQLRPHMKTHKCRELADVMTDGRKSGIAVSTLAEAEHFAESGYEDILLCAIFTEDKLPRMLQLASKILKFIVMVEGEYGLNLLEKHSLPDGRKWTVNLKVDCGGDRCGVLWNEEEAVDIAKRIQNSPAMFLEGIYAHEGDAYHAGSAEQIKEVGATTSKRMLHLADRLKEEHIELKSISIGSTPTCSNPDIAMQQLTEVHPGNYVFYDEQQRMMGSCDVSDVALRVATRVKGHFPRRNELLVDAGFTALSHDGKNAMPQGSYCSVEGHPELRFAKMSQEVGYIEGVNGPIEFERYPVGSLLFLLPYHACATATRHRFYFVHSGEKILHKWNICNGW